ncbi:MAG TPA: Ser-Thr-rich GPI-anchored membrane family protein [Cyclobacteriaceae bacterium]|nr:Ser-Thr-rich GPI-anchored membrane family protein [Cyclobacteriaceae bacterium]
MKRFLLLALLLLTFSSYSQNFAIRRVEMAGDNINVYYDLVDSVAARTYTVSVFSSQDNFVTALDKVSGDVGLEVRPGRNRKITWRAKEALGGDFTGKVGLEVRGRLYIPFVRLDGLNTTFKRLRPTAITWTGGTQQNILNFDLYRGEEKITSFPNIANVGNYTMTIPSTVKPGSGYRFKITDTKNKDQIVYSPPFAVKRKVSLLLKAVPVALLGGAVFVLTSGNKGPQNIPDPITP